MSNSEEHFAPIPEEGALDVESGSVFSTLSIKREDARYKIALYYVIGFVTIFFYALTIGLIRGTKTSDVTDLLVSISGILSGPLGFIIGYYFKSTGNEEG